MTNERTVTTNDTVDVCAVCGVCPVIHDNPAMMNGQPVCDDCAHNAGILRDDTHTTREMVREPNLTVCGIDELQLVVAIAHDGSIHEPTDVVDDIADMVKRFRLHHVTCITLVIAPNIQYHVTAITPSQTVWHITCNDVKQIAMAINTIGLAHG